MISEITETKLHEAQVLVQPWAQEVTTPEPPRLDAVIEPGDLLAAVKALRDAGWGYLSAITGVDLGVEDGQLEVLYHFSEGAAILTLRVRVSREGSPSVPSIYGLIPSVSFYEREIQEMFGITVENTPNKDRLFLPEDWPDGVYPLRKDFSMDQLK